MSCYLLHTVNDSLKQIPSELFIKAAKAGILGAVVSFGGEAKYLPYPLPAGVPLEEWDAFHSVIVTDELSRCGSGGVGMQKLGFGFESNHLPFRFFGLCVVD